MTKALIGLGGLGLEALGLESPLALAFRLLTNSFGGASGRARTYLRSRLSKASTGRRYELFGSSYAFARDRFKLHSAQAALAVGALSSVSRQQHVLYLHNATDFGPPHVVPLTECCVTTRRRQNRVSDHLLLPLHFLPVAGCAPWIDDLPAASSFVQSTVTHVRHPYHDAPHRAQVILQVHSFHDLNPTPGKLHAVRSVSVAC